MPSPDPTNCPKCNSTDIVKNANDLPGGDGKGFLCTECWHKWVDLNAETFSEAIARIAREGQERKDKIAKMKGVVVTKEYVASQLGFTDTTEMDVFYKHIGPVNELVKRALTKAFGGSYSQLEFEIGSAIVHYFMRQTGLIPPPPELLTLTISEVKDMVASYIQVMDAIPSEDGGDPAAERDAILAQVASFPTGLVLLFVLELSHLAGPGNMTRYQRQLTQQLAEFALRSTPPPSGGPAGVTPSDQ